MAKPVPQEPEEGQRVGFVTTGDRWSTRSWSGTPYFMALGREIPLVEAFLYPSDATARLLDRDHPHYYRMPSEQTRRNTKELEQAVICRADLLATRKSQEGRR